MFYLRLINYHGDSEDVDSTVQLPRWRWRGRQCRAVATVTVKRPTVSAAATVTVKRPTMPCSCHGDSKEDYSALQLPRFQWRGRQGRAVATVSVKRLTGLCSCHGVSEEVDRAVQLPRCKWRGRQGSAVATVSVKRFSDNFNTKFKMVCKINIKNVVWMNIIINKQIKKHITKIKFYFDLSIRCCNNFFTNSEKLWKVVNSTWLLCVLWILNIDFTRQIIRTL